ncbi:MAG: ArsB/NhaD family transporter [Gemmatimonadota bacterium]|nr:MAG: ArsB/NhaD family transporter [Gemmatimonadota bacterium]
MNLPPSFIAPALQDATHAPSEVSLGVTLFFTAILVLMILGLALEEKLHAKKSLIVGLFAVVSLLLGAVLLPLPYGPYLIGGHPVDMPVYIPAIDWGVITIILGASLFVDVTSRSGLFTWIAIRLTKASRGDPVKLLWYYGIMTVVFSAVLNNVTAMIIVGSLSAVSLGKLQRSDELLGFLLVEGLLTNIGGLLTLISSVPNIIVGTAAGISFVAFFLKAAPFVAVVMLLTLMMGAKLFGIRGLKTPEEIEEAAALVAGFNERDGIESTGFFWFGAAMLVLFILAIATTSVMPYVRDLGMGFVAVAFAAVMLVRYKHEVDEFYRTIDWDLLAFFAALFVVISVIEHAQVLALIGEGVESLIALGPKLGTSAVLLSSAAFSSVTDNIPLAAMLAKIIEEIPMAGGGVRPPTDPLWWAVIFGANLGGNITPIGSASTLVAVTIMHKHGVLLSFGGFVRAALPFALLHLALAVAYVLAFVR